MMLRTRAAAGLVMLWIGVACAGEEPVPRPPAPEHDGIYSFVDGCYAMDATDPGSDDTRWLVADGTGEGFAFASRTEEGGARLFMKASGLGTYLFYDEEGFYLVGDEEDGPLLRQDTLLSDIMTLDDAYVSGAEWELQESAHDASRFQLVNLRTGQFLGRTGLTPDEASAAVIALYPQEGCTPHPELTLDAEGTPTRTTFDDGDLFGIVETHSHVFSNLGFGGGGIFHGAPFHPLGVEHALPDCDDRDFHGAEGRQDIFGAGYDGLRGDSELDPNALIPAIVSGRLREFNHHTEGYPEFTDWPSAPFSSTHQTQYWRWLQRAWLGGLRLLVLHATTNSVICDIMVGQGIQRTRYSCNDMVAVDRTIEGAYALERYIDAQSGGPGTGWFRIVESPAQAREVIAAGDLAVILGIETTTLFDCFSTPREGFETCTEETVREDLDRYWDMGVRAIFPVHKFDNAFGPGDGQRGFLEAGNFVLSGHYSSFTEDCPGLPSVFDRGDVILGGLNRPRDEFGAPAAVDMSGFSEAPLDSVTPHINDIISEPLRGEYCQSHGLTPLGEFLIREMMSRGMLIEVDHLPQRSFERAYEMLAEAEYPGVLGTHGNTNNGRIYELGGVSKTGLGTCVAPGSDETLADRLTRRIDEVVAHGGFPAEGLGWDLNGFAGGRGPRFGERSGCEQPQQNPVTYPFPSFGGDVMFTEPHLGNRTVDFNTEGLTHVGLLPEYIEDARRTGATDEDLEPLFRSAEGYLRMWEAAEARAASLP